MGLQRRTIQKLLRENFPGTNPLLVDPARRAKLGTDLKARLARFDGVDTADHWIHETEKPRTVCYFSIIDPHPIYSYASRDGFWLLLNDSGNLTIKVAHYSGDSALVSDLEEVVAFVRACKQRLERHQALRAKRGKVRDLLAQAILAHVRKLAKDERFDFMTETDAQKLNLFVKLSNDHAFVLHIPFKDFKQYLPQLGPAIVALRRLYQSGIRFQILGRRKLPRRQAWITYQSL